MSVIQKRVESALQPAWESDIVQGGRGGRREHGEVVRGQEGAVGRGEECQLFTLILQGHWDMCARVCAVGKAAPQRIGWEIRVWMKACASETH